MTVTSRGRGHEVDGSIEISASPESVFDYVTDVRREPEWNPQLRDPEKLTPGPAAAGARYRVRFGHGVGEAFIATTAFDRPRSWSAISISRRLDVRFRGQLTEVPGGCQLAVHNELTPRGALRLLSPLLSGVMRRSWERDLRAIKDIVEQRAEETGPGEPR